MMSSRTPRIRKLLGATAALIASAGLLACGGGDDLAPPVPVAEGTGLATLSIGGVDLGSTPLVDSGIVDHQQLATQVMAEAVRFEGDPPVAVLASRDMASDQLPGCQIVVLDAPTPGLPYVAGVDYTVDFVTGTLTSMPDGMGGYLLPDGTDVTVDYCALVELFSLNVGVSLPTGDQVNVTFHNLAAGVTGMQSTNVLSGMLPADGSFAFTGLAAENLTQLDARTWSFVDDPAQNDATIISADLTNQLNPCIEGRVVVLMEDDNTGDEALLEMNFDDPDCL